MINAICSRYSAFLYTWALPALSILVTWRALRSVGSGSKVASSRRPICSTSASIWKTLWAISFGSWNDSEVKRLHFGQIRCSSMDSLKQRSKSEFKETPVCFATTRIWLVRKTRQGYETLN
ncbi:hypothetical protein DFS33DRAFT_1320106 [Desarmillaria ectypa]|nr:hypothetical protein DFS33DRAFT_1320106 [Desarmillaria ectypa]